MNTIDGSQKPFSSCKSDQRSEFTSDLSRECRKWPTDNCIQFPGRHEGNPDKMPAYGESYFERILSGITERFMDVIDNLLGTLERAVSAINSPSVENQQLVNDIPGPGEDSMLQSADPGGTEAAPKEKSAKKLDATGEFLWKPVSEKNGNLVVLLPSKYTGKVKGIRVLSPDGKKLASGDYSGKGNPVNGNDREHYRFNKPGGEFPDNSILDIVLNSGKHIQIKIRDSSARFQK